MDLKLTTTVTAENPVEGDLELVNGDLVWVTDLQTEVAQTLSLRLQFFQGEWYLDAREGVPYHQRLLGRKDVSDEAIAAIFGQVVRETPGVSTLEEIQVDRDSRTRQATVRFKARLEDGFLLDSSTLPPFIVRF